MKIVHIDDLPRHRSRKRPLDLVVIMTQEEYNLCAYHLEKDKRRAKK